jgi:hypothetical protein
MREGLDAPDGGPSGVRMAVFFNDLSSSASAELNQAQAFGGERANVPALAHFCCIELSQPLVRRLTFASRSLRASRFESPQLHQEVRASKGEFRLPRLPRSFNRLAEAKARRSPSCRWRVTRDVFEGALNNTRSMAECRHQSELSLETLAVASVYLGEASLAIAPL